MLYSSIREDWKPLYSVVFFPETDTIKHTVQFRNIRTTGIAEAIIAFITTGLTSSSTYHLRGKHSIVKADRAKDTNISLAEKRLIMRDLQSTLMREIMRTD